MKKIKQFIEQKREERELMRQLRRAWQMHKERVAKLPFLTDEELHDLYVKLGDNPLKSLPELRLMPPLRRRGVLRTLPLAAALSLLLFLITGTDGYAMNWGANYSGSIEKLNIILDNTHKMY